MQNFPSNFVTKNFRVFNFLVVIELLNYSILQYSYRRLYVFVILVLVVFGKNICNNCCHLSYYWDLLLTMFLTFRSNCHMRKDTCGQLVIQVPLHHCRTTALCKEKCSDDRNFVCGSDNKIYRSECEMKRNNCG